MILKCPGCDWEFDTDKTKLCPKCFPNNTINKEGYKAKMTEEFTPRRPDYSGNGIAVWKGTDKNKQTFLKVSVLNMKAINCFKVEEKPVEQTPKEI